MFVLHTQGCECFLKPIRAVCGSAKFHVSLYDFAVEVLLVLVVVQSLYNELFSPGLIKVHGSHLPRLTFRRKSVSIKRVCHRRLDP